MVLGTLSIPALVLWILPLIVGLGILLVEEWGWWLFLTYATLLVLFNILVLIIQPVAHNVSALTLSVLGILAIIYFVRKDISAPFFKMHPRGWRLQKREPIELQVIIDQTTLVTRDVSESGLYVNWPDCPHSPNSSVNIRFPNEKSEILLEGGVVRVDQNGAGIAFRGIDRRLRKLINTLITNVGKP